MQVGWGDHDALLGFREAGDRKREAERQLSGLFLRELLDQMWRTVPEGGLTRRSPSERLFRDFLNDHLADELSRKLEFRKANVQNAARQADIGRGAPDERRMG